MSSGFRADVFGMSLGPLFRRAAALVALAVGVALLPAPATGAVPVPAKRIGISYGGRLLTLGEDAIDARLADARALGATWVREQLNWSAVQYQSPTTYDWAPFDRVVKVARRRGLSVLAVINFTPPWARPAGCAYEQCAPADVNAFARFAAQATKRYAGLGVRRWEIWNEPNLTMFWYPTPDATRYASLLSATTAAIRRVDPGASIVSGGLAPAASIYGNVDPRTFTALTCAAGGFRNVSAMGFHPYSYPVLPLVAEEWNAWQQMASTTTSLRSILAACALPNLPIEATEYGAPTGGPAAVSEATQGAMVDQAIRLTKSTPWMTGLFWHTDTDWGTDPGTSENFFGLRRADGTAKPAYAQFQTAVQAAA